jgi:hypothetical protein
VPARQSLRAGVLSELQDGPGAVGAGGLHHDVLRVLDGDDHPGRQLQLVPCLAHVDDVDAVVSPLVDVPLHLEIAVLGPQMALGGQHELDVLLLLRQLQRHDGQPSN